MLKNFAQLIQELLSDRHTAGLSNQIKRDRVIEWTRVI
jgi:hypothetical protein